MFHRGHCDVEHADLPDMAHRLPPALTASSQEVEQAVAKIERQRRAGVAQEKPSVEPVAEGEAGYVSSGAGADVLVEPGA